MAVEAERRPGFEGLAMLRPEPGSQAAYAIVDRFLSTAQMSTRLNSGEGAGLVAEAGRRADVELEAHGAAGVTGWFNLPGTDLVKACEC